MNGASGYLKRCNKNKKQKFCDLVLRTFKIVIKGQVQGVGFRPFVYGLAFQNELYGNVSNDENGVIIYCNATKDQAEDFLTKILNQKPEMAVITASSLEEVNASNFDSFSITTSKKDANIKTPLTPDFAICSSCKKEVHSPENRRCSYAFTTCVNCGPRYAITQDFPFERENTSMKDFRMCEACAEEYTDPANRRFHSQTNSCRSCGIQLQLMSNSGETLSKDHAQCISYAADLLRKGKILAIKNTNGYLLCCDATLPDAIKLLRQRKQRPEKPFAVLYPCIEAVQQDFDISTLEKKELTSSVAPIVILDNRKKTSIDVKTIAPKIRQTGVMLPSSALLELLMAQISSPIIATSGNIHGSPIISTNEEAHEKLHGVADYFLTHDLKIQFPQDDSIVRCSKENSILIRRSRGLAPNFMITNKDSHTPVLAMGAHIKSTFTYTTGASTFVSQYFGNLSEFDVFQRYKMTLSNYINLFDVYPKNILIDKQANYQSSVLGKELATNWKVDTQEIQHHKAHFASVLGEHDLFSSNERILGVVWDGTGLGDDEQIWGGEFFTYQDRHIDRLSHVEYYDWLANDKMAKEPRIALFCLLDHENSKAYKSKFTDQEWSIYTKMLQNNTLKTSSVGRLFDAVASAIDLTDKNTYEGEASLKLENCAKGYDASSPIDLLKGIDHDKLSSYMLINNIVKAYRDGMDRQRLAYSFIFTLAKAILNVARKNSFKTIACSGGVFQNELLNSILQDKAKNAKFDLRLNQKLSPNDENLSFGQYMYHKNIKN